MEQNQLVISPEGVEIAHAYLTNQSDTLKTAEVLGLPPEQVDHYLNKREVKRYIDRLFNESGFRNRDKMGLVWDEILKAKLEEMDETGLGSSKDIIEIMTAMHKFNMDNMAMQLKLLELEKPATAIQVNTQNNFGGENYNSLLEKILNPVGAQK